MRGADRYRILEAKTCLYTLSPDERFIAKADGRCIVLAGFSGHGYKFAPLIGERLALVLDERLAFTTFQGWLAGASPR